MAAPITGDRGAVHDFGVMLLWTHAYSMAIHWMSGYSSVAPSARGLRYGGVFSTTTTDEQDSALWIGHVHKCVAILKMIIEQLFRQSAAPDTVICQ